MANQEAPNYLVQDGEGTLHGYWRREVMMVDLAFNKDDPAQAVYELQPGGLTTQYKKMEELNNVTSTKNTIRSA